MKLIPEVKRELRKQFKLSRRAQILAGSTGGNGPYFLTGEAGGYYVSRSGKLVPKWYKKYDFVTRYVSCSQVLIIEPEWLAEWLEKYPKLKSKMVKQALKGEL